MDDTRTRQLSRREVLAGLTATGAYLAMGDPAVACTTTLTNAKSIYYYHKFTSDFTTTLAEYGAKKAHIIYQHVIDYDRDGRFDGVSSAFRSRVQAAPAGAICALDWEHAFGVGGGFTKALGGRDGATRQKQAIAEAIKAIDAARAIRPDCKYGYYQVPFNGWSYSTLSTTPDWWLAQVSTIQPLLAHCDVLMPDIYQYYKVGVDISVQEDAKRMTNYANLCKQCSYGKPIYPFVWEIYHSAGPYDNEVISPEQIKAHVGAFTKVAGDGLYWWGMGTGPVGTEASLRAFWECLNGPYG
jgi:hypothetical protein